MIDFKQIELSNKTEIDAAYTGNNYRACDFCFTNLYAWNGLYNSVFAIIDNTIFVRFVDANGQTYYMMPVGEMPLLKAFDLIRKDAQENNIPFQLRKVSAEMWSEINEAMPNQFEYIDDRANYEYIYTSTKLIHLSGKKLQSKRNHINRFQADNPNWEYKSISNLADVKICSDMLDDWNSRYAELSGTGIEHDYRAGKLMLNNFEYLGLKGGYITVDSKIIAFSLGSQLTADTFVVHIEKAYGEVNGAYTIMNQQLVLNEAPEFALVNREEDMGHENLRKAKLSYKPDVLLEEGIVKLKT